MASLKYLAGSSLQTVTLGSSYTSGAGSMSLTAGHGARLPSSGDFWIAHDDGAGTVRIFKVTARSTDTLTTTADATEGNGDGNIASGQTLRWALTVAALDQLRGDVVQTGAYASAAATKAGNIYLPNDGVTLMRDTGAAFAAFGPVHPLDLADNTAFSDLNAPSVVSTTGGALYIASTSTGADNIRGRKIAVPSAPYTLEVGFIPAILLTNYRFCGIALYDGTKLKTLCVNASSGGPEVNSSEWNSVSSINNGGGFGNCSWGGPVFVKLEDNNTNWLWSIGPSRNNMQQVKSEARNTFLTPTHLALVVNNNVASGTAGAHFIHWKLT